MLLSVCGGPKVLFVGRECLAGTIANAEHFSVRQSILFSLPVPPHLRSQPRREYNQPLGPPPPSHPSPFERGREGSKGSHSFQGFISEPLGAVP